MIAFPENDHSHNPDWDHVDDEDVSTPCTYHI